MNRANSDSRRARWFAPLLVIFVGVVAYCNSFQGPFIFDDAAAIEKNPQIRSLIPYKLPSAGPTAIAGRPVVTFSFAVNYATARLRVESYHVTNLLIHLLAALVLYALVRRTLLPMDAKSATWLSAMVAAIWVAHPLDTQAVTYIAQRSESLASLFFLAVIYCVSRAAGDGRPGRWWGVGAVVACGLGMGSKEIVAVAPILALLYDRTFLSGSFTTALKRHWKLYAGMAATWVLILVSLHTGDREIMVGFHLGISPLDYVRTELNVIARYLRLALWPNDLVLDYYDWPIASHWSDVSWAGWLVLGLVVATVVALRVRPWPGFLGRGSF